MADDLPDSPLAVEVHVMLKVRVTDGTARAYDSVTILLPLVDRLLPDQPSAEPPPEAVQLIAFAEVQVSVVDCPAVIVVGDAVSVAVTAGQVQTTEVKGSISGTPGAVQDRP